MACIVNDVASINIDAKLVRNDRNRTRGDQINSTTDLADTIELQNGCACELSGINQPLRCPYVLHAEYILLNIFQAAPFKMSCLHPSKRSWPWLTSEESHTLGQKLKHICVGLLIVVPLTTFKFPGSFSRTVGWRSPKRSGTSSLRLWPVAVLSWIGWSSTRWSLFWILVLSSVIMRAGHLSQLDLNWERVETCALWWTSWWSRYTSNRGRIHNALGLH